MKVVSPLASLVGVAVQVQFKSSGAFNQQSILSSFRIGTTAISRCSRLDSRLHNRNIGVRTTQRDLGLCASITLLEIDAQSSSPNGVQSDLTIDATSADEPIIDRRPHEQRVSGPRKARRLNHPFQHLYRHSDPWWDDNDWNDTIAISDEVYDFYGELSIKDTALVDVNPSEKQINSTFAQQPIDVQTSVLAIQYLHLHGGYSLDQIEDMHSRFPPLLEMDVERHFRPKMRFLKDCLGGGSANKEQVLNPQLKAILPASFFGARLERTIAPRHAFLVHVGLPSGKALWDDTHMANSNNRRDSKTSIFEEFILMHRKPKQFAAMCNNWRNLYGSTNLKDNLPITSEQIVAFDKLFQRGTLSAARDDSNYIFLDRDNENGNSQRNNTKSNSPCLLQTANVTSAQLVRYLIQHGANPWETDVRGASLFHWAAGCGNLEGLQELVDGCDQLESRAEATGSSSSNTAPKNPGVHAALLWKASRDDATPLHWAAAGAGPKEFGE